MKLDKYIHELLLDNETVIIPGFGAFISTYKPAVVSKNEIKPPSKEVSFTQQFKNNDGLLVIAVARKAKISQQNALKRIEKERENMLYQLDKGEKITLEHVGDLFYNEKNEIQFTPFQEDNLLLDSFGLETISTEDSIEKPVAPASTEDFAVTAKPEIIKVETENSNNENQTETTSKTETVPVHEPKQEINIKKALDVNKFKVAEPNVKPKKKKTKNWLFLLILIPIFIVGFLMLRNKTASDRNRMDQSLETKNDQQEIHIQSFTPTDSLQTYSVQKQKVDSVKIVEPQVGLSEGNPKYYLVGGGFKNEENAEKYILRLKEKGIEGINLGKKGNMYLVGIAFFDSETEAYKALNENLKTNPGWNLWIYKK